MFCRVFRCLMAATRCFRTNFLLAFEVFPIVTAYIGNWWCSRKLAETKQKQTSARSEHCVLLQSCQAGPRLQAAIPAYLRIPASLQPRTWPACLPSLLCVRPQPAYSCLANVFQALRICVALARPARLPAAQCARHMWRQAVVCRRLKTLTDQFTRHPAACHAQRLVMQSSTAGSSSARFDFTNILNARDLADAAPAIKPGVPGF